MSGLVVAGRVVPGPYVGARNYLEDALPKFRPRRLRVAATELVIHETVTTSMGATMAALNERGNSVHLIVDAAGELTQHGDLATDVLWHAGPLHNSTSYGVEVITPYYPSLLSPGLPWSRVIHAPWAHKGSYVLPTQAQAETVTSLVLWAFGAAPKGVRIPRRWPGLRGPTFRMGRLLSPTWGGVMAHHYFGHADGAWLVLYAWMRLEAGLGPKEAYDEAARRATGARDSVEVDDLILRGQSSRSKGALE